MGSGWWVVSVDFEFHAALGMTSGVRLREEWSGVRVRGG